MLINDYMLNNREIIYTGATRAKSNLTIITNTLLLGMGIKSTTSVGGNKQRNTNLSKRIEKK